MYYAEKWINGVLHYRGSPDVEWLPAGVELLNRRLAETQKRMREMEMEHRMEVADAHAEGGWRERQGEDYGSY